jgi:ribosomal protein S18 acetylase RimI-like enzyme
MGALIMTVEPNLVMAKSPIEYRKATPEEDDVVFCHYMAVWDSYGTPPDRMRKDSRDLVFRFLKEGRRDRRLASFLALDGDRPVGSASCQLHLMPYPAVLEAEHMLQGYVWSVWVEPGYRRQGISSKLVSMALNYLRTLGCTGVVLHASDAGKSVYEKLGFDPAYEMRLKF